MQQRKPRLAPRLVGKVAMVTGGGAREPAPLIGTGKAISLHLAWEGARVLVVDQVLANAEATLAVIQEEGGEGSVFQGDVTSATDCQAMVEAAIERYGRLHVLVNNVGIIGPDRGLGLQMSEEAWDTVMAVNVKGMWLTSKYAIPKMAEGGGGSIINISSVGALRTEIGSNGVAYGTSKGAVISLTTMLAVQQGRKNIRVNCIIPGNIYTPMVAGTRTQELRDLEVRRVPIHREGTAWDIASAAVFLASDEASWVTGITLPVDGGYLVSVPGDVVPGE